MTYILFFYTVVTASSHTVYRDWRPMSEFSSEKACVAAAARLGNTEFRCISKY